ncbi:YD021 protein, partial [Polyodon spathula]|nr:YD021 protein [Polyodon spathula]
MYVSQTKSTDGVKYTLTSHSNTSTQCGSLLPCFESVINEDEANVQQETRNDEEAMYSQTCEAGNDRVGTSKDVYTTEAERALPSNENNSECNDQKEKENPPDTHIEMNDSFLKRKPGRPKKLGPQIEKRVKRPIGRPPKHKTDCSESISSKSSAVDSSADCSLAKEDESSNKTIKVTVVYGRSRRIKRLVSEGDDNISKDTDFQNGSCENQREKEDSEADLEEPYRSGHSKQASKKQVEDNHFDFVRPVKDKEGVPHPSSNIICQNRKGMAAMRKPGRPAKVRISGISVTVNTVSPKQRKICICRELSEVLDEESEPTKPEMDDHERATKEQMVKQPSNDSSVSQSENEDKKVRNKKRPVLPLRHSNRVRKPSLHFLHSVATSRAFSHSNALLRKSRKLLLNKADSETTRHRLASLEVPSNDTSEVTFLETESKNPLREQVDFSHICELSEDSIFASNAALRWWPISTSKDSLQEELHRRFQQITNSWHSVDVGELGNEQRERECAVQDRTWAVPRSELQENQVSAVKMLFQKHCDMNNLCAWFMQTTETQSLTIVRKTNAHNPSKVLHYNDTRAVNRTGICPNPPAERLSKHVKKFVQTSPTRHFQIEDRMRKRRLHVRRRLVLGKHGTISSMILNKQTKQLGENIMHRNEKNPWRRKSKFMYGAQIYKKLARRQNTLALPLVKTSTEIQMENHETLFPDTMPSSFIGIQSHALNLPNTTGELINQQQQQSTTEEPDLEEKISTDRSPETLKECRVFLTKISPLEKKIHTESNNLQSQYTVLDKSVQAESSKTDCEIEERNFCTVRLYNVLSASNSVVPVSKEREEQASKSENDSSIKKVASEGTRHSTRKNIICQQTNNDESLCDKKSDGNFKTGRITILTRKRTGLSLEEAAKKRRPSLTGWPSGRNSHWLLGKISALLFMGREQALAFVPLQHWFIDLPIYFKEKIPCS